MKFLLSIITFALLSGCTYADEKTYKWVLKQYETQDRSIIDSQTVGLMDSSPYLAIIAKQDTDSAETTWFLAVFKQSQTKYEGIALAHLPNIGLSPYSVEIANNSLFLTSGNCHHGCYDDRYQFKNVEQQLKLVGVESQGETWCSYYDEKNAPADCNYSVRFGNSYNLLSSTTICWSERGAEGGAPSRLPKQYQPRGVQHKTTFPKTDLPLLDGFNLDKFSLPKSCYFDSKKRVQVYAPNP